MRCAALALAFGLAAAGSAPAQPAPGEALRGGPGLFVSLAGEPFRAAPGEPYPIAFWFDQADRDGDGRLTGPEVAADAEAFFLTLDGNDDGRIDGLEVSAYERDVLPEMNPRVGRLSAGDAGDFRARRMGPGSGGPPRRPGGGKRAPGLQGAAPFALVNEPHPVRGADADLDQRVTRDEFVAAARRRLTRLDTDKDGALALAELPPTPIQRAAERLKAERARP